MTPEERQMLSGLFDRIRGASNGPKDRDAEAFIEDAMRNTPSAAYVLAQTVLVQQQAMEAAAHRISELEAQAKEQAPPQQETSFLGNIGRSLFGGGPSQPQPPAQRPYDARGYERDPGPPPGYAPQQRPAYAPPPPGYGPQPQPQPSGPWGAPPPPQGGGFLHGALQTATGVAGGVLLGNALGGLFGGHSGGGLGGGLFGGGTALAEPRESVNETVNNYYGTDPDAQRAQDYLQDQDQDQDAMQDADDSYASDDSSGGGDDYA